MSLGRSIMKYFRPQRSPLTCRQLNCDVTPADLLRMTEDAKSAAKEELEVGARSGTRIHNGGRMGKVQNCCHL